ncbi:MAG: asparagine synthase (glutamine-hydrolyzing) [Shewanella algae]|uniref:asparagine synthase (glutamine-hydrolyzing) n=1 Tax=Shewanella algae TaxID=38313 RepID=UPI0031F553BB
MCGFAGLFSTKGSVRVSRELIENMIEPILRRGPDDYGIFIDAENGIGLGHRRLSIIDTSNAGHQPMVSKNSRFRIVFNGEIYNFNEMRSGLDEKVAVDWQGHSDTEVLIEYISHFGLDKTLEIAVGMFAFALWDTEQKEMYLVRDRVGEKPLYFGVFDETLYFGSEISCIESVLATRLEIDRSSLSQLVRQGYICAPSSIYQSLFKVMPGEVIKFNTSLERSSDFYWSVKNMLGIEKKTYESDEEVVTEFERLLVQSLKGQMLADVPLGSFLSGGVDSSTVVALMQRNSVTPVKTFSIGFNNPKYDEAHFARRIAEHLGTEHHELYLNEIDLLAAVRDIPNVFSEPFGDSSLLPTYLVSKMAKEHVTVCLSGDGGDELFWGYSRYQCTISAWKRLSGMSSVTKCALENVRRCLPIRVLNKLGKIAVDDPLLGDRLDKALSLLSHREFITFYREFLMSSYRNIESIVIGGSDGLSSIPDMEQIEKHCRKNEIMPVVDMLTYLPDDILCKVDRCAMGNSLEGRIPLLDHRLVEFAISLPEKFKNKGPSKWVMRQVLYKYVPVELIERPKKGFSVPLGEWLKKELKEWAEGLLSPVNIQRQGYFSPNAIAELWEEHLSGKRNWSNVLWNILMFQQWLEKRQG